MGSPQLSLLVILLSSNTAQQQENACTNLVVHLCVDGYELKGKAQS